MANVFDNKEIGIRKPSTIITDEGAYEQIEGIENMELFLTENDHWQFHDSGIRDIQMGRGDST